MNTCIPITSIQEMLTICLNGKHYVGVYLYKFTAEPFETGLDIMIFSH